jgi:hypothetical protein
VSSSSTALSRTLAISCTIAGAETLIKVIDIYALGVSPGTRNRCAEGGCGYGGASGNARALVFTVVYAGRAAAARGMPRRTRFTATFASSLVSTSYAPLSTLVVSCLYYMSLLSPDGSTILSALVDVLGTNATTHGAVVRLRARTRADCKAQSGR